MLPLLALVAGHGGGTGVPREAWPGHVRHGTRYSHDAHAPALAPVFKPPDVIPVFKMKSGDLALPIRGPKILRSRDPEILRSMTLRSMTPEIHDGE